jgi:hypothetical protein
LLNAYRSQQSAVYKLLVTDASISTKPSTIARISVKLDVDTDEFPADSNATVTLTYSVLSTGKSSLAKSGLIAVQ